MVFPDSHAVYYNESKYDVPELNENDGVDALKLKKILKLPKVDATNPPEIIQEPYETVSGGRFSTHDVKDFPRCSICGDKSIGKQYGAYTCDGCKSFFRRSVRSRSVYTCLYGGGCEITIGNRNHCRHCRMMKCLDVGMRVEAVQQAVSKKSLSGTS